MPAAFFVAVGGLWMVVFFFVGPLHDWGTRILGELGCSRWADLRERLKPSMLVPGRVALLIMVVVSIMCAVS